METVTSGVLNDTPVPPGEKLYFHFDAYSDALVQLIRSSDTRTPLTIWINASWGAGKTTLMREIQRKIAIRSPKQERIVKSIWFNAWKYGSQNTILAGLINTIIFEMKNDGILNKITAHRLDPNRSQYKTPEALVKVLSQLLTLGQADADPSSFEKKNRFQENFPFLDDFDNALQQLLKAYVTPRMSLTDNEINDRKGVLVIFIDDLDRCLPSMSVETLESIKLFMDKRGIIFVIGADVRIIQNAVDAHYIRNSVENLNISEYLEKIIQVRFDLPPIHQREMQLFIHELPSISDLLRSHLRTIASYLPTNPRKVKNFINHINLQWTIIEKAGLSTLIKKDLLIEWFILNTICPDLIDVVENMEDNTNKVLVIKNLQQLFCPTVDGAVELVDGTVFLDKKPVDGLLTVDIALLNILIMNDGKFINRRDLVKSLGTYFIDTPRSAEEEIENSFNSLCEKMESNQKHRKIFRKRIVGQDIEFCYVPVKTNQHDIEQSLLELLGSDKLNKIKNNEALAKVMKIGGFNYSQDTIEYYVHLSSPPGLVSVAEGSTDDIQNSGVR